MVAAVTTAMVMAAITAAAATVRSEKRGHMTVATLREVRECERAHGLAWRREVRVRMIENAGVGARPCIP